MAETHKKRRSASQPLAIARVEYLLNTYTYFVLVSGSLKLRHSSFSRVTKRQTAHSTVKGLGNFLALEP